MRRQAGPAEWEWLANELKTLFPWLGTDEPAEGADVIDGVNTLYAEAMRRAQGFAVGDIVSYEECGWRVEQAWPPVGRLLIRSMGGPEKRLVDFHEVRPIREEGA